MDGSQIIFILATAMAIIVIIAAVYWYTKFYRTMIYKCPQCGYEGKPNVAKTCLLYTSPSPRDCS